MEKWVAASVLLLIWAISASMLAVYYRSEATRLNQRIAELTQGLEGEYVTVNLGIGIQGGEVTWHNGTRVKKGSTLLDVTLAVASVNYTEYPGMGAFVESINGVANSNPYYWMWWTWTDWGGWQEGPIAADRYVVMDGETLFWYYEDTSQSPLPTPP
ncbi:MAG: DUF4430 domain-containing protein [Candidatus Korarchaeota archaeon]|nr:DUF4430 domain-containing protein [Candidatus Korarchaeota archaeon]